MTLFIPMRLSVFNRKLRTLLGWSWIEYKLFIQVYLALGVARFAVLYFPFRWTSKHLGSPRIETKREGLSSEDREKIRLVSAATRTASRYTLWNSNCLAQAISAKLILQRMGMRSTLFFGVLRKHDHTYSMQAHAWLRCGKIYLVGGASREQYTIVASFA